MHNGLNHYQYGAGIEDPYGASGRRSVFQFRLIPAVAPPEAPIRGHVFSQIAGNLDALYAGKCEPGGILLTFKYDHSLSSPVDLDANSLPDANCANPGSSQST